MMNRAMRGQTVILSSGGLRSLVATALGCTGMDVSRVTLITFKENRGHSAARLEHAKRQAQHRGITRVMELALPTPVVAKALAVEPANLAVRPRILLEGMAAALALGAERLIWPVHSGGDYRLAAKLTEETVLLQHLTQLEKLAQPEPVIDAPLLELTDQQLIELGAQMDVPWQLAWTCTQVTAGATVPCRACEACRRRRRAFDAAGLADPVEPLAHRAA
jgi:7-cyano-7-deazaguanine synthase